MLDCWPGIGIMLRNATGHFSWGPDTPNINTTTNTWKIFTLTDVPGGHSSVTGFGAGKRDDEDENMTLSL